MKLAVVGTGIAGLSVAWLLAPRHRVTVYERNARVGGHTHTARIALGGRTWSVDTGFIVYNEPAYPNLTALFEHLRVATRPTDMSFAASLRNGALEYSGTDLGGLLAQPSNALRPRFWSMLRDIRRFYCEASAKGPYLTDDISLGQFLDDGGYGAAFRDDHLLPMAAAIWSAPAGTMLRYPARAFIAFCKNHGLLQLTDRPPWRTVAGGSYCYVEKLTASYRHRIKTDCAATRITRTASGVRVHDAQGQAEDYDHVILACHADEALALLAEPSVAERALLGSFTYAANEAVLHGDAGLMPQRRAAWSSWNYIGDADRLSVTYWMNRLQDLPGAPPLFVTLNPVRPPDARVVFQSVHYTHPIFDTAALAAQRRLWALQGVQRTWYCGAYFGSGFHEDALQSGLAVAEGLAGCARPWQLANPNGRIHAPAAMPSPMPQPYEVAT